MKRWPFPVSVLLSVCIVQCPLPQLVVAQEPGGNVVANPNIEAVAGGRPVGWNPQGKGATLATDSVHEGKFALKLDCSTLPPETDKWQFWRSEAFELPSQEVKVSCWARAEKVRQGRAMVYLQLLDSDGKPVEYHGHLVLYEDGTFPWSYFERYARLPATAKKVVFTVSMSGAAGTLWVDDVRVTPGAPKGDATNLFFNPGFEETNGSPDRLLANGWLEQGEGAAVDAKVSHTRQSSLRIHVPDVSTVKDRWQLWRSPYVEVTQGELKFSCWVKLRNVKPGKEDPASQRARLHLQCMNGEGKHLGWVFVVAEDGAFEWRKFEQLFTPPVGTKLIQLTLILDRCAGTVWLDDVSLSSPAVLSAMKKTDQAEWERLMMNVGFGQPRPVPVGWNSQGSGAIWEDGAAHSGKRCLRFSMPKPPPQSDVWQWWRGEPSPFGGKLHVSFWVKGANIAVADAYVGLQFYDEKEQGKQWVHLWGARGTFDWKRVEADVAPQPVHRFVAPRVGFHYCTGDLWVDEVTITDSTAKVVNENGDIEEQLLLPSLEIRGEPDLSQPPIRAMPPYPIEKHWITIGKDGNFHRHGRPVFLIAANETNAYPWLSKMLTLDYVTLETGGVSYAAASYYLRGKKAIAQFGEHDHIATEMHELLSAGILPTVALQEMPAFQAPFANLRPDLLATGGHFFSYSQSEPDGRRLREAQHKSVLQTTRRYPVFLYELWNEVNYMSNTPQEVKWFRERMAKKYGNLEVANKAWQTSFTSFDDVIPPAMPFARERAAWRPGWTEGLYVDWLKFTEERFGQIAQEHASLVRKCDPQTKTTIQSYYWAFGVNPRRKVAAEDVFGDERYMVVFQQIEGAESLDEMRAQLEFPLAGDLVRGASPSKPIVNEEAGVQSGYKDLTPSLVLADLAGKWKFQPDNDDKGDTLGYSTRDFDDSQWADIKVPANWADEGYPQVSIAWYRKRFDLPQYDGTVYLVASTLADDATLYLNGQRLYRTKRYNEAFSLDVSDKVKRGGENILTIELINQYYMNNHYWGGIREYVKFAKIPTTPRPVTAGEMRMYLWSSVACEESGTHYFNLFTPEGGGPWDFFGEAVPNKVSRAAYKAIPQVHTEINQLGDIVLPRPRQKAEVALVYPQETIRAFVPERMKGDLPYSNHVRDVADWYGALFFAQIPLDVIVQEDIAAGRASSYKMLVMPLADRGNPAVLPKLQEFVERGGMLVAGPGAFRIDDESHGPLDAERLLGVRWDKPINESRNVRLTDVVGGLSRERLPSNDTSLRRQETPPTRATKRDGTYGKVMTTTTARAIATYEDGSSAIACRKIGRGAVYTFGCELDMPSLRPFLESLSAIVGVTKPLLVRPVAQASPDASGHADRVSASPPFLEARCYGRGGRYLWYLNNWGAGAPEVRVSPGKGLSLGGVYRLRASESPGRDFHPFGKGTFSLADLQQGIRVKLPSHEPLLLLLETSNLPATPVPGLAPKQRDLLKRIWNVEARERPLKVLFADYGRQSREKLPSAMELLDASGFQVDGGKGPLGQTVNRLTDKGPMPCPLSDYRVVVYGSPMQKEITESEVDTLKKFVEDGGGLLICGNYYRNPHGHYTNWYLTRLSDAFGIHINEDAVCSDSSNELREPRFVVFTNTSDHPVTRGVRSFHTRGMASLTLDLKGKAVALVTSGKDDCRILGRYSKESTPNAIVAAAAEAGKGRVVVLGDASWMEPDLLAEGDDGQLLLNVFAWLAAEDASKATNADRRMILGKYVLFE